VFDLLDTAPGGSGGTGRVCCGLAGLDPGIGGGSLLVRFSEMTVCGRVGESCKGCDGIGGGDRASLALGRMSRAGIGGGAPLFVEGISSSDSDPGVGDCKYASAG